MSAQKLEILAQHHISLFAIIIPIMSRVEDLGVVKLPAIRIKKDRYKDSGMIVKQEPATLHLLTHRAIQKTEPAVKQESKSTAENHRHETQENIDAWFDIHLALPDPRHIMDLCTPNQAMDRQHWTLRKDTALLDF